MKTNSTPHTRTQHDAETLLEWANTRRAQAATAIDRHRERGEDVTDATAAYEQAMSDYRECERYFLGDDTPPSADTLARIDEAGANLPEADEATLEGALQAARNAHHIAQHDGSDADTVALLAAELRLFETAFIRSEMGA